jgi:hypothetical protein
MLLRRGTLFHIGNCRQVSGAWPLGDSRPALALLFRRPSAIASLSGGMYTPRTLQVPKLGIRG